MVRSLWAPHYNWGVNMNKIVKVSILIGACFSPGLLLAQQGQGSAASSSTQVDSNVNNQFTTNSDMSQMVPSVVAPGLATTLTETCMGSTSAGGSGAGFGFSFGTTWRDSACVRRLDARQMSGFGDIATAREVMCDSDLVREAAKRVGRPCMEDGGKPFGENVPQSTGEPSLSAAPAQFQQVPSEMGAAPVVTQQVRE